MQNLSGVIIKLLEENRKNIYDIGLRNVSMYNASKAQAKKPPNKQVDDITLKTESSRTAKKVVDVIKKATFMEWEEMLANHSLIKGYYSKYIRNSYNSGEKPQRI